jgi:alkylation response protein AidB-like acyl-CoA dehydrogenase
LNVLDLDFSPEQELLRHTARDLLSKHCPLSVVREMEDDPIGYPVDLWKQMGDLDLIGLLLPEEFGGSGMTLLEGVALYEELGRALAPTPHLVSAILSGLVLARAGTDAQRQAWLPKIASGDAIISPAWMEPENGFSPRGVTLTARESDGQIVLSGLKRHVLFAKAADRLLVLARSGEGDGDIGLYLVDPQLPGVSLKQQFTIASDTQYEVRFDDVVVSAQDRIGSGDWGVWEDVLSDAYVLMAAQAVGGARYALEISVEYAKTREQFDKPLGAFQALAHYLADAVTTVDGAEQLVHEAAWARANGRPVDRLAPMSKLFACQTFRDVTAMAQQLFGGIGFTLDFDIQLYFRRAKQLQISWSDNRALEQHIADAIFS